ncbi:MAG: nucleotidyltransferase domain-containing protein [Bacteroidota bacterium]
MTIQEVKQHNTLLLECISGSRAYGLHTPQSDTDLKGVFLLPKHKFYGLEYEEQANNETNDEVYYELRRFVDLLVKNNPNILELLNTPADSVKFRHPVMDLLKPELFLSKLCKQTFAGYAQSQIKKAKGLNKKIVNPVDKERKSIVDFCHVIHHQGSITLSVWLEKKGLLQEHCGLVNISHMRDVYAIFHNNQLTTGYLKGICSGLDANDVSLSSVEKGLEPLAILSFNKDGYSKYCKDYKEYWDWVEKRNELRYENTIDHGKNYDAKNMMHTFRLLNMAEEIAKEGVVNVRRHDREFLLKIRSGAFSYEELVELANEKIIQIDNLYDRSSLPEQPDIAKAEAILVEIRERMYTLPNR